MSNLENEPSLGDSSGSDGSLAKDLSHQAEMNFASQGILPFENENDLERSRMVEMEKGQTENVIEEEDTLENCDLAKEAEIAPKYIENAMMPDLMEEDCNSNEALMLCEYCHGPITKMKKFGKSGQQFCSKQCAESQTRNEDLIDDDGNDDDEAQIDTSTNEMTDVQDSDQVESSVSQKSNAEVEKSVEDSEAANLPPGFDWNEYRKMLKEKAAPKNCFGRLPKEVKGLIPGMKLEALDKNNPCNYCVATVIDVVGRRVRIRYDGFGNDDSQDFWCNFQADELYPIGWCAENSFPLQPPAGITSTLEDWKIFLTKTLTGALATPMDLFRENEFRLQTKVHSFQAGMRVECIHPKKPSIICPARVTKSLGPYVYQITTEPLPHLPAHMFYGNSESNGIFSFGWTMKNGIDLALPAYLDGSGLTKDQYVAACRARSAPAVGLHKRFKNGFKLGQKLEAVDLEEPSVIRVATVFNVIGRILHLLFDGRRKFQYVDCENEDIFPIGWCMKTGHPLSTPYGMDPCTVLHSKSLRKAARPSNLQQAISSLSAKLLTNHIKPDAKKKRDRRFDVYGKSSNRSRRPRATTLSDHCDFYCYDRVIPPSSCEHCFVARDNWELDLETDSESESMNSRHKEKSRNYCCCTPCYCRSNRSSEQSRHKRQPFCLDRTHRNEGHPFCSDLAHRSETTADRGDTTEETVYDNVVRESPCCIRNTLKSPTHRSLKRRLENSNTEDELSNVMQAVNKVKHDLANAVEIINNNMLQLTRKLDLIDEKLSKRNVINTPINQSSQSNNNKKAKRVARSIQVNLNAANTVHKTRTKSSLQRKFSTFKRNQVRRHSVFNKTPSSSGSSQGVIPAMGPIASTYSIVSSSHITSDSKLDRPTMVPNFSSFQVIPNIEALPVNETFPVPKRPDLNTGSGFKNPVSSFGHEIKTVESNHTVENPCIGNKTHEQQEYQQQHSFSPDKRSIASVDPVIESSFSLRSMHGPPAPNTNTNASTLSNPSKSPDSIAPMPDGFELTGTEALKPVIEVPTGERLYIDAILQELPDDKSDAIKFMASKGTISRYEFSLKLLDLFFTEEEQCNDAASGGGVLRNLDYVRVHKIKALSFYFFPLTNFETEDGSWRMIVKKLNAKCRCRRFALRRWKAKLKQ